MSEVAGRRVYWDDNNFPFSEPGDYGFYKGAWHCIVPAIGCAVGNLNGHTVTEHEDGTITVTPSILVYGGDGKGGKVEEYHGYLTRGVWKSC